jgi:hypothetical protein
LLRRLADQGWLSANDLQRASQAVRECIAEWTDAGWLRPE